MANRKKTAPTISIEISPGEALDRYAILLIKAERVKDKTKQDQAVYEAADMWLVLQFASLTKAPEYQSRIDSLLEIHGKLWDTENDVRQHEKEKDFGPFFIRAARRVYKLNDQRSKIKNEINEAFNVAPEVKEYSRGQEKEIPGSASAGRPHAEG